MNQDKTFVEVLLPLAIETTATYRVDTPFLDAVKIGIRVEVEFGKKKRYSGIIIEIHHREPKNYKVKPILSVIDEEPIVSMPQLQLWKWIAQYYSCTEGEVMLAALPIAMRLNSETSIHLNENYIPDSALLSDKEYLVVEALLLQNELSISQVQGILQQNNIHSILNKLISKGIVYTQEAFKAKYKPKMAQYISFFAEKKDLEQELPIYFEQVAKAKKQEYILLKLLLLLKDRDYIQKSILLKDKEVSDSALDSLIKKNILKCEEKEVSRIASYREEVSKIPLLSTLQQSVFEKITDYFNQNTPTLLHGITGSGKTNIYFHLIEKTIQSGKQVLYLLPEIALTTQIINRLQQVFGNQVMVYHSKLNSAERVEIWLETLKGKSIILGARSSSLLPFSNLGLIIVDEEHDPSYKQKDVSPRYNGRDTALILSNLHKANILLGSATPSLESYYNCQTNKMGLVTLMERYKGVLMPEIQIIETSKSNLQTNSISKELFDAIQTALDKHEQIILFQNRRGFAPTLFCDTCDFTAVCNNCDVTLTYHKYNQQLKCHYCGYQIALLKECPSCLNKTLKIKGLGTEKIEDELVVLYPKAVIRRFDQDSIRGKDGYHRILESFANGETDILVGTQMVTKGLDFDNVGLVGIINADQLINFPDFRSAERAFQMMVQAAGRSGRRDKTGKVFIQTSLAKHPLLAEIKENNYSKFYGRELAERKKFEFPPYFRLIKITAKHQNASVVKKTAEALQRLLKSQLGKRVLGPTEPAIARIKNQYIQEIWIKMEKEKIAIQPVKAFLKSSIQQVVQQKESATVKIIVDIDPY